MADRRWSDCPECRDYYDENRDGVLHGAASVGIEHGLTSNQALSVFMRQKHENEHLAEYEDGL